MRKKEQDFIFYKPQPASGEKIEYGEWMMWFLVAALYGMGVQMLLANLIPLSVEYSLLLFGIGMAILFVFVQTELRFSRADKWMPLLWPGAALILCLLSGVKRLYQSGISFLNRGIYWWNIAHEDGKTMLATTGTTSMGFVAFLLFVSVFLYFILWWGKKQKKNIGSYVITVFMCVMVLVLDHVSWYGMSLMFLGQWGLSLYRTERGEFLIKSIWSVFLLFVFVVAVYFYHPADWEVTEQLRETVKQGIEDFRYGENHLPEGNLYEGHTMLSSEEETLKVKTEQVKNLYLHGFLGAEYEDGVWKPLKKSCFGNERSGMLDWLKERQFAPAQMYARYANINENEDESNINHISIENIGVDREYLYVPFSVMDVEGNDYTERRDEGYHSATLTGAGSYEFRESSEDLPGELLCADSWVQNPTGDRQRQYMEAEMVYRSFVYDNYTSVNEELKALITKYFVNTAKTKDKTGVYAITGHIRQVLRSMTWYNEEPKAVPEEEEPIEWYLLKEREGNAALFASTAVEAFRCFGIPARYAEGYLLQKKAIEKEGGSAVTLTGKDAHAWVQVYIDAIGWVDIDVTPGFYYNELALIQMVEQPQGVQLTADLEDEDAAKQEGNAQTGKRQKPKRKQTGQKVIIIALNIVLLLAILIVFAIAFLEWYRWGKYHRWMWRYAHSPSRKRCLLLYESVMKWLTANGIEAGLGWQTKETGKVLKEHIKTVYDGEYELINTLLEKGIYGGEKLENWELRAILEFREKLIFDAGGCRKGLNKIRFRYR